MPRIGRPGLTGVVEAHPGAGQVQGHGRYEQAARDRDPSARSLVEITLGYPGVHAVWFHRIAHRMWRRPGLRLPARLLSQETPEPGQPPYLRQQSSSTEKHNPAPLDFNRRHNLMTTRRSP